MSEDRDIVEMLVRRAAEDLARRMCGIVPDRIYPPDEAAELIGLRAERREKTIKEIPPELLPLIPITPMGKVKGYLGRDLIAYIEAQRLRANPHLKSA